MLFLVETETETVLIRIVFRIFLPDISKICVFFSWKKTELYKELALKSKR